MKLIDSSSMGQVVSEYMWLCLFIPKTQAANSHRNDFLPAPSVGRRPLEIRFIDSSSLGYAVSKHIWLCGSITKAQEAICEETTFFLLLQGGRHPLKNEIH